MAAPGKDRTKATHDRRRERGLCINGEAFVRLDGRRVQVERFLEEKWAEWLNPADGTVQRKLITEVELDPSGHGPARRRHGRCDKCWTAKLDAEKERRRQAAAPAAPQSAAKPKRAPARGGRRRKPQSSAQGAFTWAA